MKKILKLSAFLCASGFYLNAFSLGINENLFASKCNIIDGKYKNCRFDEIEFQPYSKKFNEEMSFLVNYEFRDCNFKKLFLELNSNANHAQIVQGSFIHKFEGKSLYFKNTYPWFTQNSEFISTCSFKINSVEVSFSRTSVNKINDLINTLKENNAFLNKVSDLKKMFTKLNMYLQNLDNYDFFAVIDDYNLELKNLKDKYNNELFIMSIIDDIETEIFMFLSLNRNLNEIQLNEERQSLKIILEETLKIIDTDLLYNNILNMKNQVNEMLREAENTENFNKAEIKKYKKLLSEI